MSTHAVLSARTSNRTAKCAVQRLVDMKLKETLGSFVNFSCQEPFLRSLGQFLKSLCMVSVLAISGLAVAASPGVTDSEIRIGQFAAQTGPAAELGKRMQLGIQAHFAAVNAAGGINGRKLGV